MNKPQKPNKKIECAEGKTFYFDHSSHTVSLQYFLDWIKENAPKEAYDFTISMDECIDENEGYILGCNIYVGWKRKIKNKTYAADLKRYQRKNVKRQ
jgi:hypothetical protein